MALNLNMKKPKSDILDMSNLGLICFYLGQFDIVEVICFFDSIYDLV